MAELQDIHSLLLIYRRWTQPVKMARFEATWTEKSPWYIIPADKKLFTRLAVSEIVVKKT